MKYLATLSILLLIICTAEAQKKNQSKFKFGDIKPEDFAPTVYSVDSSADAVYLFDVGSSHYEGNARGDFSVVYEKHVRIRLLNKKSFDDLSTEMIPLFQSYYYEQKLEDFKASTFNIENGAVVETKLEKGALFKDKLVKSRYGNFIGMKFTMPNLKEGCIIEYDYKVSTPSFRRINEWFFQSQYPKLWSQYTVEVPAFFDFIILRQGYIPYAIDSAFTSRASFNIVDAGGIGAMQVYSFQANTVQHIWAQQNVPAIRDEEYITTLDNYISKIEFQLSSIRYPDRAPIPILRDWYSLATEMMKDEDFGLELTQGNNWLKDDVKAAIANAGTDEQKIKNIYTFVREAYDCVDDEAIWLSQTLKKTQQAKKGNVADINLLLTSMLKIAGYDAKPAILSTRENGYPYEISPILDQYNYVIVHVKTGEKNYNLDASDRDVGFNHLPLKCYNLGARLIDDPPIIIDLAADSLHETKLTTVFVMNDEKGMSGSFSTQYSYFNSQPIRDAVQKSGKENYFTNLKKSISTEAEITNLQIDSLKIPEEPVTVKFDAAFKAGDDDILYFDPMLGNGMKDNPFKSAERNYPVEMEYCTDETFLLNMEIPKGYKIDELPKSARVNFNEDEGMFEYIIAQGGGRIQMRCRILLKKATFEPDDYESLREFFGFIVSKEAEQIVFKKE